MFNRLKLNRKKQTYKPNPIKNNKNIDLKWKDRTNVDLFKIIFQNKIVDEIIKGETWESERPFPPLSSSVLSWTFELPPKQPKTGEYYTSTSTILHEYSHDSLVSLFTSSIFISISFLLSPHFSAQNPKKNPRPRVFFLQVRSFFFFICSIFVVWSCCMLFLSAISVVNLVLSFASISCFFGKLMMINSVM